MVAGLSHIKVESAERIISLLQVRSAWRQARCCSCMLSQMLLTLSIGWCQASCAWTKCLCTWYCRDGGEAELELCVVQEGNTRRKTESTDANAVSSRSHAVLEVQVRRKELSGASVRVSIFGLSAGLAATEMPAGCVPARLQSTYSITAEPARLR